MKPFRLGTMLVGLSALLGAAGAGCLAGGSGGVAGDYYGPHYGGTVAYGRPYYGNDAHLASPPSQSWHGSSRPTAPAKEDQAAPAKTDHRAR